jgi:hypothetical protein
MKSFGAFTILAILATTFSMSFLSSHYSTLAVQNQDPKIYLPIVFNKYPFELDAPPCRWNNYSIAYKWGSNLQTPGSSWRTAFESAVVDWNVIPTKFYFYYSASGNITMDTYYDQFDGLGGKTIINCDMNTKVTIACDVLGNIYYSHTVNVYHSLAGHETGHSQSIGHVADQSVIALMGHNPNPEIYYTPQQADIDFVNTIYP